MAAVASSSSSATSQWADLSFVEVLEDLSSRFIVNLPNEELQRIERICFQVEQAHWFYEDFLRPLNASLPSLNLRKFSIYILQTASLSIPLIRQYVSSDADTDANGTVRDWQTLGGATYGLEAAFDEFMKYKTRVPVCGAVLLSDDWKSCLLVKGWKSSAAWGFPKGKINQSETHRDCAVRETYEETGFDCSHLLKPDSPDWMELNVREQKMRLYIVPGVKKDTPFETQTRKEISKIAWFKLSDLPTWKQSQANGGGGLASANAGAKFYLVTPFIGKLKQWIRDNKKRFLHEQTQSAANALQATVAPIEGVPAGAETASSAAAVNNVGSDAAPKGPKQPVGQPLFVDSTSAWPLGASNSGANYGAEARTAQTQPQQGGVAGKSDPSALLAMLQGSLQISDSQPAQGGQHNEASQGYAQPVPALDQRSQAQLQQLRMLSSESPLPAPRAQKASGQTLKLLEMLSPNSPMTDRAEQNQQAQAAPSAEDEKARKREALLNQLLKGAAAPNGGVPAPQAPASAATPTANAVTDRSSKEAALLSLLQGQSGSNAALPAAATPASMPAPPPPSMPAVHPDAVKPESRSPAMPHFAGAHAATSSPDAGRASLLAMLNAGPTVPHHREAENHGSYQGAAAPPVPGQQLPHHLSPHPHYASHNAGMDALSTQPRSFEYPAPGGFAPHLSPFNQHAAPRAAYGHSDPLNGVGSLHAGLLPPHAHGPPLNGSSWGSQDMHGHVPSPGQHKLYPAPVTHLGHSAAGPVHPAAGHADASPMYAHASPGALPAMPYPPPGHGYQPPPNFQHHPPPYLHAPPPPQAHYQGDVGQMAHGQASVASPSAPGAVPAGGNAFPGANGSNQSNGNQSLLALLNGRQ